jgi:predicted alpha/beta-hydrolase family hydrolase
MIEHMKRDRIEIKTNHHQAEGLLLLPSGRKSVCILLAHGAGNDMNSPFISFFHEGFAEGGYPSLKFNFPYSQIGRKVPDPQPVLTAIYRKAIESAPFADVIIGGKSMGGRIASYVADEKKVKGLFFLGYPLHAPGKPDLLRDEHLYEIRKPMFFASGTKDPFARPDLLSKTLKKIGRFATFQAVDGGGHSFEVPKKSGRTSQQVWLEVLKQTTEWLRTLDI